MKKFIIGILTFIWLGFSTIFAQNILPDEVKISVKDPIVVWEAANLKITILKNWSKMTSYEGTILIQITDENWTRIRDNERVLPSLWWYSFLSSDLWEKEFQKWLEIKKEWTFYIEISDLNQDEDKILWKQVIHVIKQDSQDVIKNIEIINPKNNANLIWNKVDIIARAPEIPNSTALIYIDEGDVDTTIVQTDWSINHSIWNLSQWQHSLAIEIPDLNWQILWKSEKIYFNVSPNWESEIKNVIVEPEKWLMTEDMVTISVYTDEMVESVKVKLSDRSESVVMNKNWAWQFIQNVFLIGTWEISLSFETSSINNTVHQSYDNYKTISVSDVPYVDNVKVQTDIETQSADVSWEVFNGSNISSYLIDRRIDWPYTLSWKERSEKTSFRFNDVPYDTTVNLAITPYRNNQSKHWAASKTIQFVISKNQTCWNWICDNWESHELCPQDCDWTWATTIILWPSCPVQTISTRTEKIWDSYYLIRDKAENVKKYIIYSSESPDWKDKIKVYETSDTSYEYPFDHTSEKDIFMYFRIVWVCEDWEEIELTWATKVQVWPAENFFLLICLTLLIYFWIKLFRHTED